MVTSVVIRADCIEHMKTMEASSVSMVFADPPFNLKKAYKGISDEWGYDAYMAWTRDWIQEAIRILSPSGSLFVHHIPRYLIPIANVLHGIASFRHWIVWNALGTPGKNSPLLPSHYGILFYTKSTLSPSVHSVRAPHARNRDGSLKADWGGKIDSIHPFGAVISDVWGDIHRIKHKKDRDNHPCQLPVPLLERIVLMSTNEGDVVFDPFVGTGTTAVAAKRLGRNFVGTEQSADYVDIANENIERLDAESKIGNCYVSMKGDYPISIRDKDWTELTKYFDVPEGREIKNRRPELKR